MNEARPPGHLSAAELFRDHGAFVARFLYRLGVPAQVVEDTVQDVFLVVHQRGGYRPGPAKPTTYLAVIASDVASSEGRRQRRRAAREGNTSLEELRAPDDDPALCLERRDDLRRLQDALSWLDPALRDTLVLADFEDETAPAIAHTIGVPPGTVYWRLHEARKKFQSALAADRNGGRRPHNGRLRARRENVGHLGLVRRERARGGDTRACPDLAKHDHRLRSGTRARAPFRACQRRALAEPRAIQRGAETLAWRRRGNAPHRRMDCRRRRGRAGDGRAPLAFRGRCAERRQSGAGACGARRGGGTRRFPADVNHAVADRG